MPAETIISDECCPFQRYSSYYVVKKQTHETSQYNQIFKKNLWMEI